MSGSPALTLKKFQDEITPSIQTYIEANKEETVDAATIDTALTKINNIKDATFGTGKALSAQSKIADFIVAYTMLNELQSKLTTDPAKYENAKPHVINHVVKLLQEGNKELAAEIIKGGKAKSKKRVKGGESYSMGMISNVDGLLSAADPVMNAAASVPMLINTSNPVTSGLNTAGIDNTASVPKGIVQSVLPNLGGPVSGGRAKPKRKTTKRT